MSKGNLIIVAIFGLILGALADSSYGQKNRGSRKTDNARVAKPGISPGSNIPVNAAEQTSLGRADSIECVKSTGGNQRVAKVSPKQGRENSIECLKGGGNNRRTAPTGGRQNPNVPNGGGAPGSQTNVLPYVEQQNVNAGQDGSTAQWAKESKPPKSPGRTPKRRN